MIQAWKQRVRELKRLLYALYVAYRDPRTPWLARVVVACVIGYAFSPIDLIPDFIPVLGYLDDLVLLPFGIALAIKLIPPLVWQDAQHRAAVEQEGKPTNWIAAGVIVALWLALAVGAFMVVRQWR